MPMSAPNLNLLQLFIVLIYNSRTFEIHLPGVVDVIGVPMIEVVVAVILVVDVVGVISMIRLDTK